MSPALKLKKYGRRAELSSGRVDVRLLLSTSRNTSICKSFSAAAGRLPLSLQSTRSMVVILSPEHARPYQGSEELQGCGHTVSSAEEEEEEERHVKFQFWLQWGLHEGPLVALKKEWRAKNSLEEER